MKKDKLYHTGIAVVGDYIEYELNADGTGSIYKIDERNNYFSRKAPKIRGSSYRGERLEQIIASNIDILFIVTSVSEPPFNNKTLDRFIVAGESSDLNIILVLNKIDLANNSIIPWINLYEDTGYKVIKTSALTNEGIDDLKKLLTGSKNLFFGKSGVGKSSLLNKMYPGLDLKIGKISSFTDRGTHTTVTSTMLKVDDKTFIIDTPGIREFDPFGIKKEDLGYYFIEFLNFKENCRFTTCTHSHEPGCAVITAVRDRLIKAERYDSYLRILNTIEEDIVF